MSKRNARVAQTIFLEQKIIPIQAMQDSLAYLYEG